MEDGSYGFCELTGNKIGLKRLQAQPWATLSIKAVEELESACRQNRPVSKAFA
ncbi:MAG: TraR/DksA family transcriptional regulator [Thermodesulfobacteriota bacterium]